MSDDINYDITLASAETLAENRALIAEIERLRSEISTQHVGHRFMQRNPDCWACAMLAKP